MSGADAASIVMGTLSEQGTLEPSRRPSIFWGVATGAVAAVMLLVGGRRTRSLSGLQNITIVAALPFLVVMVGLCVALVKDLRRDPLMLRAELGNQLMEQAVIAGVAEHGHEDFAIVLEPHEDSDSARAGAGETATAGSSLPDPVPPVRRRTHRHVPRRNAPRGHTKAATQVPRARWRPSYDACPGAPRADGAHRTMARVGR